MKGNPAASAIFAMVLAVCAVAVDFNYSPQFPTDAFYSVLILVVAVIAFFTFKVKRED